MVDKNLVKPLWYPIIDFDKIMNLEESKVIGRDKGGTLAYTKYRLGSYSMVYAEALKVKFSCPFCWR